MAEGQDSSQKKIITITIKTPKEKQSVEIEEDASIKDVSTPAIYITPADTKLCNITHKSFISVFNHC